MPGGKQAGGDRVDRHLIRQHHPSAGDVRDIRGTGLSAYAARDQGTRRRGYEKGNQEYASHGISPLVLLFWFCLSGSSSAAGLFLQRYVQQELPAVFLIIRFASRSATAGKPRSHRV